MKSAYVIAGNWKMNKTISEGIELVSQIQDYLKNNPLNQSDVVVCPPATLLKSIVEQAGGSAVEVGSQNLYSEKSGAFTGEISAEMVRDTGATLTLIGHSERRQFFNETAEQINKKIKIALDHQLEVIYCVGETLDQREDGLTEEIISNQIELELSGISAAQLERIVIAYEPVWAIGTGKTASPEQAQQIHLFIRTILTEFYNKPTAEKIRILYGGSVKPDNAAGLLAMPDINGALVGGACLKADSFVKIIEAAENM